MDKQELFRSLPSVDEILVLDEVTELLDAGVPRAVVLTALRKSLDAARQAIGAGILTCPYDVDAALADTLPHIEAALRPNLLPIINATGIIVHTNLGRSVLPNMAVDAVAAVNAGYSNLEYRIDTGKRGSRHEHVEALICELTGAEAAMAVNNNAAAVMLTLAALAAGKQTIVSRGQLVEIGGSFRIPDIMAASGTHMVEVGTTNKTHLRDFERALNTDTALLFKAHTSNYKVSGFVEEVPLSELVALGDAHHIPVVEDLGSGVLLNLTLFGLPHEPTVQESITAGASLVSFSGDKLLGGPQAGIICGRANAIAALKAHPIARAVRLDKMTLAALEATLRLYRDKAVAVREIPTLRMLAMSADDCRKTAEALALILEGVLRRNNARGQVRLVEDDGFAGGGSLPDVKLSGWAVALQLDGMSESELEEALRTRGEVAIIGHLRDEQLLLNARTLSGADLEVIAAEVENLLL